MRNGLRHIGFEMPLNIITLSPVDKRIKQIRKTFQVSSHHHQYSTLNSVLPNDKYLSEIHE